MNTKVITEIRENLYTISFYAGDDMVARVDNAPVWDEDATQDGGATRPLREALITSDQQVGNISFRWDGSMVLIVNTQEWKILGEFGIEMFISWLKSQGELDPNTEAALRDN